MGLDKKLMDNSAVYAAFKLMPTGFLFRPAIDVSRLDLTGFFVLRSTSETNESCG